MSGKLASAVLTANTLTDVYTVPAGRSATVNVSVCNKGNTLAFVYVAASDSATPQDADWIEYGARVSPAGGVLERMAVMLSAGEHVVVRSTAEDTVVRIHGIEEIATDSAAEAGSTQADMRKSTYDPNGDGKVSSADVADGIADGHTIAQGKVAGLPATLATKFGVPICTATAGIAITAPAFVNLYDDSGMTKVRLASNDGGDGYQAHGFVTASVASGASANVYMIGFVDGFTGLIAGEVYLGTAGQPTQAKPTAAGRIRQRLGVAVSATKVWYVYSGYELIPA
jgi:hypothetical protein